MSEVVILLFILKISSLFIDVNIHFFVFTVNRICQTELSGLLYLMISDLMTFVSFFYSLHVTQIAADRPVARSTRLFHFLSAVLE